MPAVFSRLDRTYLEAQHPPTGNGGLRLNQVKHLIRLARDVRRLQPSPQNFPGAINDLLDLQKLLVSWQFILTGIGPHHNDKSCQVDLKLRELFQKDIISVPIDQEHIITSKVDPPGSSPLLLTLSDKNQNQLSEDQTGGIDSQTGSLDKTMRLPTPMPGTPLKVWKGSREEYEQDKSILWGFLNYDPKADVKLHDPKTVVVSFLGDEYNECVIERYHDLDLSEIVRYNGLRLALHEDQDLDDVSPQPEPEPATMDDLDPSSLITVSVMSRGILNLVLNSVFINLHDEEDWVVSWALPGYPIIKEGDVHGDVLYTYRANETPHGVCPPIVTTQHQLPALGPANALRILLFVASHTSAAEELTPSKRRNILIAEYLRERNPEDSIIEEIQIAQRDKKTKGHPPACWERWAGKLWLMLDFEDKIPIIWREKDIRRKKITAEALGLLIGASGEWVGKCKTAYSLIKNNRSNAWLIKYLLDDEEESALGIDTFIVKLREGLGV
ncbi:hypothetical protein DFH07DRAFT_965672 [Mycena maculata]|uniref:Uncharacterized protein n=1 Tax=Mycena maculata TaxID=230809 RepID=A0AAD7IBY9_9AGAR|nr:hypothetical protein DFH07DRAFT_965672 [Mycena maculata]